MLASCIDSNPPPLPNFEEHPPLSLFALKDFDEVFVFLVVISECLFVKCPAL